MMLTSICDRIEHQIKASAVWVELDRDGGAEMDEVLDCISGNAADGRFCAVVSTTPELIDAVAARVESAAVELIVNADEAQRLAALALAAARSSMCERVMDIAADQSAERLRQLGDEVSRIAATLARLSSGPTAGLQSASPVSSGSAPEVSAESCAE
jgi:hypothetical protein